MELTLAFVCVSDTGVPGVEMGGGAAPGGVGLGPPGVVGAGAAGAAGFCSVSSSPTTTAPAIRAMGDGGFAVGVGAGRGRLVGAGACSCCWDGVTTSGKVATTSPAPSAPSTLPRLGRIPPNRGTP